MSDVLDPLQDFAEEGVVDVADDHTQGLGLVGLQAAGGGAGMVAHLQCDQANAFGGFVGDQGAAAQRPGNRGVGDPGTAGDILDGGRGCIQSAHVCIFLDTSLHNAGTIVNTLKLPLQL